MENGKAKPPMDDMLADFMAEINAMPEVKDDIDGKEMTASGDHKNANFSLAVQQEINLEGSYQTNKDFETHQDALLEESQKKNKYMYNNFTKGSIQLGNKEFETSETFNKSLKQSARPETKTTPSSMSSSPIELPTEPVCEWQQCLDESSQYPYYWNYNTNAVTWDIPPEYTKYLLEMNKYNEQLDALRAKGVDVDSLLKKPSEQAAQSEAQGQAPATEQEEPLEGQYTREDLVVQQLEGEAKLFVKNGPLVQQSLSLDGVPEASAEDCKLAQTNENSATEERRIPPDMIDSDQEERKREDDESEDGDLSKYNLLSDDEEEKNKATVTSAELSNTESSSKRVSRRSSIARSPSHSSRSDSFSSRSSSTSSSRSRSRSPLRSQPLRSGLSGLGQYGSSSDESETESPLNRKRKASRSPSSSSDDDADRRTHMSKASELTFDPEAIELELQATLENMKQARKQKEKEKSDKIVQKDDKAAEQEAEQLAQLLQDKLDFFAESLAPLSLLQTVQCQLQTRTEDLAAGALLLSHYVRCVRGALQELASHEQSVVPVGWSAVWSREYKRYYFMDDITGDSQWEFPEVSDAPGLPRSQHSPKNRISRDLLSMAPPPPPSVPTPPRSGKKPEKTLLKGKKKAEKDSLQETMQVLQRKQVEDTIQKAKLLQEKKSQVTKAYQDIFAPIKEDNAPEVPGIKKDSSKKQSTERTTRKKARTIIQPEVSIKRKSELLGEATFGPAEAPVVSSLPDACYQPDHSQRSERPPSCEASTESTTEPTKVATSESLEHHTAPAYEVPRQDAASAGEAASAAPNDEYNPESPSEDVDDDMDIEPPEESMYYAPSYMISNAAVIARPAAIVRPPVLAEASLAEAPAAAPEPVTTAPAPSVPLTPAVLEPAPAAEPVQTPAPSSTKKKKKGLKTSSQLGIKKKNMTGLVSQWQQRQTEIEDDIQRINKKLNG